MTINNLPTIYRKYVIAMWIDGEFWYWGSFDNSERANEVACEVREERDCSVTVFELH